MENIGYNLIKSDEKGEITVWEIFLSYFYIIEIIIFMFVKNEEIKRVIKLLNYESSDRLKILEDLFKLLKRSFIIIYSLYERLN